MNHESRTRDLVVRYLLGNVEPTEREQIENSFLSDEAFFDCVLIEDQLIYDYLNNRLAPIDRKLFEENYLHGSKSRQEKVALSQAAIAQAKSWKPYDFAIPEQQPLIDHKRNSWRDRIVNIFRLPEWALATLVVLVVSATLLVLMWRHQKRQLANLEARHQTENEQLQRQLQQTDQELKKAREAEAKLNSQNDNLVKQQNDLTQLIESYKRENQAQKGKASSKEQELASLHVDRSLEPSGGRGASGDQHAIVPKGTNVTLYLMLRGPIQYQSHHAELKKIGESSTQEFPGLEARETRFGKAVVLTLTAKRLKLGTYVIALYGRNSAQPAEMIPVDTFQFTVK